MTTGESVYTQERELIGLMDEDYPSGKVLLIERREIDDAGVDESCGVAFHALCRSSPELNVGSI